MEIVTVARDRKICGTCRYWDGARENETGRNVRCLKRSEGICLIRKQRHAGILETIVTCESGENCQDWCEWVEP